jgi:hypothetical protein
LRLCADVDLKRAADDSIMLGRAVIGRAATVLAIFGIAHYRRDLRRDRARVARFAPSVIDTPFGRVEDAQAVQCLQVAKQAGAPAPVSPVKSRRGNGGGMKQRPYWCLLASVDAPAAPQGRDEPAKTLRRAGHFA